MKTMKRISVIGAGAIGSAYASMLYDHDPARLVMIADGERYERYRERGIVINGKVYRFPLVKPDEDVPPADLVIVSVKHQHLGQAIADMRRHVGPETAVMSLLNGITSEEIIGRTFGADKMLYALVVGIDAVRDGDRVSFSRRGSIRFGEKRNETLTPRVRAVKDLFDRAGIPCEVPEDMLKALFWKFMLNVGVNQVSAVLRAPYGVFQRLPEARALMDNAMREALLVGRAEGLDLGEKDLEQAHVPIGLLSPEGKTSMLQDVEAGRKSEVEIFGGTVIELGRKHGIPTPVNEQLFLMIKTIEGMKDLRFS